MFAPDSKALVDASFTALRRAKAAPAGVLKPLNPNASGVADEPAWPGEGQYLFAVGGMPTSNYITGPTYLLNWGITTSDKVNFGRVRAEAIAFTEMILRLGRTPPPEAALMRRAALVAVIGVLVAGLGVSEAAAAITQPPQPKSGPGGSDYAHAGWRVSSGGSGADAWYVFEPARPRPEQGTARDRHARLLRVLRATARCTS